MKYRTFRNLALIGGATVLTGFASTCVYLVRSSQGGRAVAETSSLANSVNAYIVPRVTPASGGTNRGGADVTVNPANPPASYPAARSESGQRREDQLILSFLAATPATTDKVKDAFPRERFKVNFYRDDAGPNWTRLKIDTDRDGKDDEKWDLQNGQLHKRKVSTRDDEQYDREYRWRNAQWVEKN